MAEKVGHIKLNAKAYRIDMNSYQGRDVTDFSPRASTPGGGIVFSNMSAYQTLAQEDWRHGFGFDWHVDAAGYMNTTGYITTNFKNRVMMSSDVKHFLLPAGTDFYEHLNVLGFARTHGGLYVAYGVVGSSSGKSGMYKLDSATKKWTPLATFNNLTVNYVWTNGVYTFALIRGGRIQMTSETALINWSITGNTVACRDYSWAIAHNGFVFLGRYGDGTINDDGSPGTQNHWYKNQVYYGSTDTLSDLEGSQEDDTDEITVGIRGEAVIKAFSYNAELFFVRRDSIYKMSADRVTATKVLDYTDQYHPSNFDLCIVYNGSVYFNIRERVYQWNGVRTADVTPPILLDNPPYYVYYNEFQGAVVVGDVLFVMASYGSTLNSLLAFDGTSWTKTHDLVNFKDTVSVVNAALGYFPTDNLLAFAFLPPSSSSNNYLFYASYGSAGEIPTGPYPVYDVTLGVEHAWISSRIDAGFRMVTKSTPQLVVDARCTALERILLYYKTDTVTTWTAWGTQPGLSNLVQNGINVMSDPKGTGSGKSSLEYKWIQFKAVFQTETSTVSPELRTLAVRMLLRPDTWYGYNLTIIGAQTVEHSRGKTDDRSPYGILSDLRTARDSKAWVVYVDPYGVSHNVYVTSVQETAVEEHIENMGPTPNIEQRIQINLLEV